MWINTIVFETSIKDFLTCVMILVTSYLYDNQACDSYDLHTTDIEFILHYVMHANGIVLLTPVTFWF